MEKERTGRVWLYYEPTDAGSARLAADAVGRTATLLHERWALELPRDCHLFIMTSWQQFMLHAPPPLWRVPLALTLPLWAGRVRSLWQVAGGWTNRFGRRVAIGVKPPRVLELADRRIGEQIFIPEPDLDAKLQQIACHELTHAATAAARLPLWLNEGLAVRAVDAFCGHETVRRETLEALRDPARNTAPLSYRRLRTHDREQVAYQFARGYWLTRWLDEHQPGLLLRLISSPTGSRELERLLAQSFQARPSSLWAAIDDALYASFARPDGANG